MATTELTTNTLRLGLGHRLDLEASTVRDQNCQDLGS